MRVIRHEGSLELSDARGCMMASGLAALLAGAVFAAAVSAFIRNAGWGPGMFVAVAAAIAVIGALMFAANRVPTTTVLLMPGQPEIHIRRRRLLSRNVETLLVPLREVDEALVEVSTDSENSSFHYVALRLRDGKRIRLSEIGHGARGGQDDAAAAINEFLAGQRRS